MLLYILPNAKTHLCYYTSVDIYVYLYSLKFYMYIKCSPIYIYIYNARSNISKQLTYSHATLITSRIMEYWVSLNASDSSVYNYTASLLFMLIIIIIWRSCVSKYIFFSIQFIIEIKLVSIQCLNQELINNMYQSFFMLL